MKTAYIVQPLRTPITKAFKGSFRKKRPDDFAAELLKKLIQKIPSVDINTIDDVIVGCAMPEAEQGMNVARFILLEAGLPENVPGYTLNRFCSSGLQSIATAAFQVQAGFADAIFAGGTESMSLIPMMGNKVVAGREVMTSHPEYYLGMGMTAENVAKKYNISREDQDKFSLASHQKSIKAIKDGTFKDEIVPISWQERKPGKNGETIVKENICSEDEGPREDSSMEGLTKLRPAFLQQGGTVTAGNSSQMSDGAAFCLVCSEEYLKKYNLTPIARFCGFAAAGVPPNIMGIGPVEAIPRALKKSGVELKNVDHFELNEAFAAQSLAVLRELKIDESKVNPYGGAIALGHPLGATGAKLTATLLHSMKRKKQKYGIVTMCIGTGMGAAGVFEAL